MKFFLWNIAAVLHSLVATHSNYETFTLLYWIHSFTQGFDLEQTSKNWYYKIQIRYYKYKVKFFFKAFSELFNSLFKSVLLHIWVPVSNRELLVTTTLSASMNPSIKCWENFFLGT